MWGAKNPAYTSLTIAKSSRTNPPPQRAPPTSRELEATVRREETPAGPLFGLTVLLFAITIVIVVIFVVL